MAFPHVIVQRYCSDYCTTALGIRKFHLPKKKACVELKIIGTDVSQK